LSGVIPVDASQVGYNQSFGMAQETTYQALSREQAETAPYLGAEMPISFGDPGKELEILRAGCGIFDLAWRQQIVASGKDRVRWLHNMVTNNIRDLKPGRGNYNFVLNAQGRILGDLYIFNRGESLLMETDKAQVDPLLTAMKRFIIMDKVELTADQSHVGVAVCGPKSAEVLEAAALSVAGMDALEVRDCAFSDDPVVIIRGPEQKPGWYELWVKTELAGSLSAKLRDSGAHPVGTEALEAWRVLQGIPQYGQDIRDRDLPHETEQQQALNFNKGCYIGQEIVERIRSRGQVHRKFTGFEFEGPATPGKHEAEGRVLAEVTTVRCVPASGTQRCLGLGYVRRESVPTGATIEVNGVKARMVDLPFQI